MSTLPTLIQLTAQGKTGTQSEHVFASSLITSGDQI